MSNHILYEDSTGRIAKVMAPRANQVLFGGDRIGWRDLSAKIVPYTSQVSGALASVEMALDHFMLSIGRMQAALNTLQADNERIDGQQTDMLNALRKEVYDLNRYCTETVTLVRNSAHMALSVSIASNAALTVDSARQCINLDLSARGSFDDSRTQLGVTSIQLALESLASRQTEMMFALRVVQDNVNNLQKSVRELRGE